MGVNYPKFYHCLDLNLPPKSPVGISNFDLLIMIEPPVHGSILFVGFGSLDFVAPNVINSNVSLTLQNYIIFT